MADPLHLEWLLEGVESWDKRRSANDFTPDLSHANFRSTYQKANKLKRSGRVDLYWVNLRGADLSGADLRQADLRNANLCGAVLRGAHLNRAYLLGAQLLRADLSMADLRGADMRQTNLRGVDLQGADLLGANLRGASVKSVNWSGEINEGFPDQFTDLSTVSSLKQEQLDTMNGDTGVILPPHLKRPARWPDWRNEESVDDIAKDEQEATPSPEEITTSISSLRKLLTSDGKTISVSIEAVSDLILERIEILEGNKPNNADDLPRWEEKHGFLLDLKKTLDDLGKAIPADPASADEETAEKVLSLYQVYKEKFLGWPRKNADEVADGIWRVGFIGVCAGVGGFFGMPLIGAGIGGAIFGGPKLGKAIGDALKGAAG